MFVLDGGSLLHRMKWSKNATYKELAMQYVHYVQLKYGNAFVVFDGYGHGPSLKDHEHQRRVKKISAEIQLQESMEARVNQQAFLANEKNKSSSYSCCVSIWKLILMSLNRVDIMLIAL